MTDEESKTNLKMLEGHVGRLKEQGFDSVQIFCSKFDNENGTRFWNNGGGNYLARVGQVILWIEDEKQLNARKEND